MCGRLATKNESKELIDFQKASGRFPNGFHHSNTSVDSLQQISAMSFVVLYYIYIYKPMYQQMPDSISSKANK